MLYSRTRSLVAAGLLAGAASACTIPSGPPLSNTITTGFAVQVQNASYPEINNLFMNLFPSGGGDQHLFVGPVGNPTNDLTLVNGVITWNGIRAVINGEFSEIDDTTKMFMTERGDPRAFFQPTYTCNPETDELQVELTFVGRQFDEPGGWICVRPSFDDSHEFRYYPPGNTKVNPSRFCKKVTLVAVFPGGIPDIPVVSSTSSSVSTSTSTTSTVSSTSAVVSTSSSASSIESTSTSTSTSSSVSSSESSSTSGTVTSFSSISTSTVSSTTSSASASQTASPCTIPPGPPLSNNLTGFAIQIQNASYPEIHNLFMNLFPSGGGDQHLFVGPVGNPTNDLTLVNGVITWNGLHGVINLEPSEVDDTIKLYMTERTEPLGFFQPTYACNPETGELQVELTLVGRQNAPPGGWICVRPSRDNSHEFRYYPPGNTKVNPMQFCKKVTLVAVFPGGIPDIPDVSSTSSPVPTSTSSATSTASPTSTITSSSASSTVTSFSASISTFSTVTTTSTSSASAATCTIPPGPPLSNNITTGFAVQVQNASYPEIHNLFMNLFPSGGGDQHLFVGPVGNPTNDLTLVNGVITWNGIRAVINGEFSEIDDTTKMFMTERGDPRAFFQPTYACNPDTGALQLELTLVGRQFDEPGGWICVRPSFDNSHEFRYYPPGNTKVNPMQFCKKVTLVAVFPGDIPDIPGVSSTSSSVPTSTSSTTSTASSTPTITSASSTVSSFSASISTFSTVTTTSTSSASASQTPLPYTDLTSVGFAFVGCAPEERSVQPPDGAFRTLPVLFASDTMTGELCMAWCADHGYAYAGLEYRRECWCGNSYAATREPGTTLASLAGCSMPCAGNPAQKCGGADWLSLYRKCPVGGPCENAVFT